LGRKKGGEERTKRRMGNDPINKGRIEVSMAEVGERENPIAGRLQQKRLGETNLRKKRKGSLLDKNYTERQDGKSITLHSGSKGEVHGKKGDCSQKTRTDGLVSLEQYLFS